MSDDGSSAVIGDNALNKHTGPFFALSLAPPRGNILFNTTIATAIADRLVENSEIFLLCGDSLGKAGQSNGI
jgi:hypothetical protein